MKICSLMQPTSKDVMLKALEQIKPNIPAKPARAMQPVVKPGGGVKSAGGGKAPACSLPPPEGEEEDAAPSARSSKSSTAIKGGVGTKNVNGTATTAVAGSSTGTKKVTSCANLWLLVDFWHCTR